MARCAREGCGANALKIDSLCFQHSELKEIVESRDRARKRGGSRGKLRQSDVTIGTVQDVKAIIAETLNDLRSCSTDNIVAKSRAIGYLCGVALTAIEKGDLEERIAKLEEAQTESTT